MAETPEVSVVIPTRNRWALLARTLRSALDQVQVAHQVVVVDDGSTDETSARLAEIHEPRVQLVRHERCRGQAAARNSGIAVAGAEWLAFLDDDDLWSPRKLRVLLDASKAADATFGYSAGFVVDDGHAVLETWPAPDPDRVLPMLLTGNWIPAGASNSIAKTNVVRRLGGFDEGLNHFADWDMWIRLAAERRVASSPEPLVARVLHPQNLVLTDVRLVTDEFGDLVSKHRRLASSYGVAPDRVIPDEMGVFRWLGWAQARAGRRARAARWYLRAALGRSPYGRRRTLADAGSALLGRIPVDRVTPVDEAMVSAADWLDASP
jgi:glycosyltransferase involved in cell wall biosynthesis